VEGALRFGVGASITLSVFLFTLVDLRLHTLSSTKMWKYRLRISMLWLRTMPGVQDTSAILSISTLSLITSTHLVPVGPAVLPVQDLDIMSQATEEEYQRTEADKQPYHAMIMQQNMTLFRAKGPRPDIDSSGGCVRACLPPVSYRDVSYYSVLALLSRSNTYIATVRMCLTY
jgi:hypothetical protein